MKSIFTTSLVKFISILTFCFVGLFQLGFGQNNCPSFPKSGIFDTLTYIKSEIPTDAINGKVSGNIYLGQGWAFRKNGLNPAFIPNNKPTWALAIAHAWNYERNLIKRVNFPQIGFWLGTAIQETELGCVPGTTWDLPSQVSPTMGTAAGTMSNGGCLQIEGPGSGYGAMSQAYPNNRFPVDQPTFAKLVQSPTGFETSCLIKAYYDMNTGFIFNYYMGWKVYESVECTKDKYAYIQTSASCYNAGPNSFLSGAGNYNRSKDNVTRWTGLPAAAGGYPEDVASWTSVLENDPAYPGYPAGSKFDSYYNKDITWTIVTDYLDIISFMYPEINFATSVTPKVQAAFVKIAGSTSGKIPFMKLGPVIDQIILNLPAEYPVPVEGSPVGVNLNCSGTVAPSGHYEVVNGGTNLCLGESVTLVVVVDGGGGANPTFKWYNGPVRGKLVATTAQYTYTPSAVGTEYLTAEICNGSLCYPINTSSYNTCTNPINTGGVNVTTKKCSNCTMTASAIATNTPCKGMNKGTINVSITNAATNWTLTYSGSTPLGVVTGTLTGTGNTATIQNVRDGDYNITVESSSDPNCKAKTFVQVGFTTDINEYVDAKRVLPGADKCKAELQADIINLPAPCQWTVKVYPVELNFPAPGDTTPKIGWENVVSAVIKPASTGSQFLKPTGTIKYQKDQWTSYDAQESKSVFSLYTGDAISVGIAINTTPGAKQLTDYWFHIINPLGTLVKKILIPKGSAKSTAIYFGTPYTVTCPSTPAAAYDFTWNPALSGKTDTPTGNAIKSVGKAAVDPTNNILYTVTATNKTNAQCVLTDTVTVKKDGTCVPVCTGTKPTTPPTFEPGSPLNICSPATTGSVQVNLPSNAFYQLFTTAGAAFGSPVNGTTGKPTIANVPAGVYEIRTAGSQSDLATATCFNKSVATFTVNAVSINPTILTTGAALNYCSPSVNGVTLKAKQVAGATYEWFLNTVSQNTASNKDSIKTNALAGDWTVKITSNGCSATSPITKVNAISDPSASITSTDLSYCSPTKSGVALKATAVTGATYQWIKGATNMGTASASADYSGLADDGSWSVKVSVGSCVATSTSVTVKKNIDPTVTIISSDADNKICLGDAITLSGSGASSYVWDNSVSNGTSFTPTSASTTTFKVIGTDANNCAASASISITISPLPVSVITPFTPRYCSNEKGVTLSLGTAATQTYEWQKGGITVTSANAANTSQLANQGSWTVKVVNTTTGCSATSAAVLVDTLAQAKAGITTSASGLSYCASQSGVNLTAKTGGTSYKWFKDNIEQTASTTSTFTNATGTAAGSDWKVIVNNANNCPDTSATVQVKITSSASASIKTTQLTYCAGQSLQLEADDAGTGAQYQWYKDGVVSGGKTINPVYSGATAGKWKVEVTTLSGCTGMSAEVTVAPIALPTASITNTLPIQYCAGNTTTLTAQDAGAGASYAWFKDASATALATTAVPNLTKVTKGDYTLQVSIGSCVSTLSSKVTVIENTVPKVAITGSNSYCSSQTGASLTATRYTNGQYTWIKDGVNQAATNNNILTATAAKWKVILKDQTTGCADTTKTDFPVTLAQSATATLSGNATICKDLSTPANLSIALTGPSPWDVTYKNPDGTTNTVNITTSPYQLSVTQKGNYTLQSVSSGSCGAGTVSGTATVNYLSTPDTSNYTLLCPTPGVNKYQFSFQLSGGDVATYNITGATGTFTGNVWTSALIDETLKTTISITDKNNCEPITIPNIQKVCSCPAEASISGSTSICSGNTATVSVALKGSAPWSITYTDGTTPVTVNNLSNNVYTFDVNKAGKYTLSNVSDVSACSGSLKGLAEIKYYANPTATISGDRVICVGSEADTALVNLSGQGPWNLTYTDGTTSTNLTNVTANPLSLYFNKVGNYSLTALTDANTCVASTSNNDLKGTAKVTAYQKPDTSNVKLDCNNSDKYTISLSLTGGNASTYQITGTAAGKAITGKFTGNAWASDPIGSNIISNLSITDGKNCNPITINNITKTCICPATASISAGDTVCEGNTAQINLSFAGTAPFTYIYSVNSKIDSSVVSTTSSNITVNASATYQLLSIRDKNCVGTIDPLKNTAKVKINPTPSVTLSGGGTVCKGQTPPALKFEINGSAAPYTLNISNNGVDTIITNITSLNNPYLLNASKAGNYSPSKLTDANGCIATNIQNLQGRAVIAYNELPTATIAGGGEICEGDTAHLSLQFAGSQPFTLTYDAGAGSEVITDITTTDYKLDLPVVGTGVTLVEVYDKNYCVNKQLSGQNVSLEVTPLPILNVVVAPLTDTICDNTKTKISLSNTSNTTNNTYFTWNTPLQRFVTGGQASTGNKIEQLLTNTSTKKGYAQYTVQAFTSMKNGNACASAPKNVTIYVRTPTEPKLGEDLADLCVKQSLKLSVAQFAGGTYQWFKDGALQTSQTNTYTDTVTRGTSTIKVTYKDVCDNPHSDEINITSKGIVQIGLSAVGDSCMDIPFALTPFASEKATMFTWKINTDSLTSTFNAPNIVYQFTTPGTQNIKMTAFNSYCWLGDTTVSVKIKDCTVKTYNTITPNGDGANDFWTVDGIENFPNATVQIFNRWGDIVKDFNGNFSSWDGKNSDGKDLEDGVYYYVINLQRQKGKKGIIKGYITIFKDIK